MNEIDRVHLLAELVNERCELNHGPETENIHFPASDFLVLPMGYAEDSVQEVCVRELVVPVCFDCAQALCGDEWTLFFCIECCSSQWVYRKLAKNRYRHHILWLRGCPDCTYAFGGLYFNDITAITGEPEFLTHHARMNAA